MLVEEIYQCIDCTYEDTGYHRFSECYFCNELICSECLIENKTNSCDNCNYHSKCIYFESNLIKCSLCNIDIMYENYCDNCNYLICTNCKYNDTSNLCINCYESEIYSKFINLN